MIEIFNCTGVLEDDIELFKEYLGDNFISCKLITTKDRNKVYLVNENTFIDFAGKFTGHIYVLGINGIIGLMEYEIINNAHVLIIQDIQFKDPDYYHRGIGTGMLKFIQQYAGEKEIKLIKGILSQYDVDNYREMLINFYSKHDFNVDFYHREVKKILLI